MASCGEDDVEVGEADVMNAAGALEMTCRASLDATSNTCGDTTGTLIVVIATVRTSSPLLDVEKT